MSRLIATDLDGTLLPEGTFHLNPEYYQVIRRLHDQGDVFVAASGRHYSSMRRLLEPVQDCIIFLCGNGTYVTCRGVPMAVHALPDDVYERMIPLMRDCGGFICADTADAMWTDSHDEVSISQLRGGYRVSLNRMDDLLQLRDESAGVGRTKACSRGILKCALRTEKDAGPIAASFRDMFGSQANIMTAGEKWVDCVPAGVDKGIALSQIQESLRFDRKDTIAFGDNGNDIGMLKCAGESFCVEGGRSETKEAADHVIGRMEDDAVLQVLRKLVG